MAYWLRYELVFWMTEFDASAVLAPFQPAMPCQSESS